MMRQKSKNPFLLLLIISVAGLQPPAVAQHRRWREIRGKPLVEFDWNCASTSAYPSVKLNRIVQTAMKQKDFVGAGTWGDRAFVFDLNGDRKAEYFVPLDCGGTGNCTWGIFSLNPARLLGFVSGQSIYVHRRAGRYPDIITYTHMSASEGILATYSFRKRVYVWLGDEYPTSVGLIPGNNIPVFLKKARAACEKLGY
jgi:hypothetical protein